MTNGSRRARLGSGRRPNRTKDSCRQESSWRVQRDIDFLTAPRGVGKCGLNIGRLQVGVGSQDLLMGAAGGEQSDDSADRHAHAANAWLAAHYGGVVCNAFQ